jgi:SAM-dependent methyltransferase
MTTSVSIDHQQLKATNWPLVNLRCQRCGGSMGLPMHITDLAVDTRECARCSSSLQAIDGIWRAILPARARQLDDSLAAYEAVREREGRWSNDAKFYLSLPWRDTTERFSAQWRIRAKSFEFVRDRILPERIKAIGHRRLRVLDLGAGNCWMSYRLALDGHFPVAVDIGLGRKDGLGAATHYVGSLGRLFPRFQAEMDRLPFADGQFDVAIYNASLHYAQDYEATVREAVRVLRPNGAIVIMDSPTYDREADGEAMMDEKAAEFVRKFGTVAGGMGGQGYLTPEKLAHLHRFGIRWRRHLPWHGWAWAMRPVIAGLSRRRRPSKFYIHLGTLGFTATETA